MKRLSIIFSIVVSLLMISSCSNKSYYNLFSSGKSYVKKGYLIFLNDLYSNKRLLDKDGYPLIASDKEGGFVLLSEKCQFSNGKLINFEGDVVVLDLMQEEEEAFFKYSKKLYDNIKSAAVKHTAYGMPVKIIYQVKQPSDNENNPKMTYKQEIEGTFIYADNKYTTNLKFGYMLVEFDWDWMETHTNYKDLKFTGKP